MPRAYNTQHRPIFFALRLGLCCKKCGSQYQLSKPDGGSSRLATGSCINRCIRAAWIKQMWNLDYEMYKITEETRANRPRKNCKNVNSFWHQKREVERNRFDSMASKNEETKPWKKMSSKMVTFGISNQDAPTNDLTFRRSQLWKLEVWLRDHSRHLAINAGFE